MSLYNSDFLSELVEDTPCSLFLLQQDEVRVMDRMSTRMGRRKISLPSRLPEILEMNNNSLKKNCGSVSANKWNLYEINENNGNMKPYSKNPKVSDLHKDSSLLSSPKKGKKKEINNNNLSNDDINITSDKSNIRKIEDLFYSNKQIFRSVKERMTHLDDSKIKKESYSAQENISSFTSVLKNMLESTADDINRIKNLLERKEHEEENINSTYAKPNYLEQYKEKETYSKSDKYERVKETDLFENKSNSYSTVNTDRRASSFNENNVTYQVQVKNSQVHDYQCLEKDKVLTKGSLSGKQQQKRRRYSAGDLYPIKPYYNVPPFRTIESSNYLKEIVEEDETILTLEAIHKLDISKDGSDSVKNVSAEPILLDLRIEQINKEYDSDLSLASKNAISDEFFLLPDQVLDLDSEEVRKSLESLESCSSDEQSSSANYSEYWTVTQASKSLCTVWVFKGLFSE